MRIHLADGSTRDLFWDSDQTSFICDIVREYCGQDLADYIRNVLNDTELEIDSLNHELDNADSRIRELLDELKAVK